jgi:hypothetical protein
VCGVVWWIGTKVSEGFPASIFRVEDVKTVMAGYSEILNPKDTEEISCIL